MGLKIKKEDIGHEVESISKNRSPCLILEKEQAFDE
jgi:hypothetical protein